MERSSYAPLPILPSTSSSAIAHVQLPKDLVKKKHAVIDWQHFLCGQPYSLSELVDHYEGSNKYGDMFKEQEEANGDKSAGYINYLVIKQWLLKKCGDCLIVEVEKEVQVLRENLPLFNATKIRPDLTILDKNSIPITEIEVHSSLYSTTLNKLILVLLDQLRFLRNCDCTIQKCSGFAFPKNSDSQKSCVTKMDISWNENRLHFYVDFRPLTKDEVVTELKTVLSTKYEVTIPKVFFAIPLSPETLQGFGGYGGVQVYSRGSILVRNQHFHMKYQIHACERVLDMFLDILDSNSSRPEWFLLPDKRKVINSKPFLFYKNLIRPLTRSEAGECLSSFIESVAEAVHSLHKFGYAHLDIRLENICFSNGSPHHAVLIDLDRCRELTDSGGAVKEDYEVSVMYTCASSDWTVEQVDWLQLSLMFHFIQDRSITDYHHMQVTENIIRHTTLLQLGRYMYISTSQNIQYIIYVCSVLISRKGICNPLCGFSFVSLWV